MRFPMGEEPLYANTFNFLFHLLFIKYTMIHSCLGSAAAAGRDPIYLFQSGPIHFKAGPSVLRWASDSRGEPACPEAGPSVLRQALDSQLSTEQFPASAYVGSSKNLKDLKASLSIPRRASQT